MYVILSMSNQALVFLTTVIIGVFIGFVYDLFRVLRKVIHHSNLMTYLEDLVYWIFVSLIMFYVMLNKNYGEIRVFSILGAFLGMILYFLTLGRLFMAASLTIIDFIKKVFAVLFEIIMTPFKLIYKLLEYPLKFCKKKIMKYYANIKMLLHKSKNYARIKKKKISGDIDIIMKKI